MSPVPGLVKTRDDHDASIRGDPDAYALSCLWFDGKAEEAAEFYTGLFPDSHIDKVWRSPADTPSGPAGMVLTVDFTVGGQRLQGLNGGDDFTFNEAVSLVPSARTRPRSTPCGAR